MQTWEAPMHFHMWKGTHTEVRKELIEVPLDSDVAVEAVTVTVWVSAEELLDAFFYAVVKPDPHQISFILKMGQIFSFRPMNKKRDRGKKKRE